MRTVNVTIIDGVLRALDEHGSINLQHHLRHHSHHHQKESSSDSEGEASRSRVRPKREEESSKVAISGARGSILIEGGLIEAWSHQASHRRPNPTVRPHCCGMHHVLHINGMVSWRKLLFVPVNLLYAH